jgi:hypothetical protein
MMMSEKIELKEKLAAVDIGAKTMWDEMDDEQRKSLKQEFFILNRYISNVKGQTRETQEHFVLTVNEFFNKYWNDLSKHPKLMWQLLCMCSHESKKIYFHEWIGFKKKKGDSKRVKFLEQIYPQRKPDEIELLVEMTSLAELKQLAEDHGYSKQEIAKMF